VGDENKMIAEPTKKFIFLYPIPEYVDHAIGSGMRAWHRSRKEADFLRILKIAHSEEEKKAIRKTALRELRQEYGEVYSAKLNECIDARYRQKGFCIYFAIFDGHEISDAITLHETDCTIQVGLDFETHTTKVNGAYPYPDTDFILDQLGTPRKLVVAGFHMWDCVERFARRAHERGLDVLVDEDLTEFFPARLREEGFCVDTYPTYNPHNEDDFYFEMFTNARMGKPWLWQDY